MKSVTIGGIGNVLLGDDGIGPYAVRALEAEYSFEPRVQVVDLGTPGLGFVAHLSGVDCLILIDSVENGETPGTVTLYRKEDLLAHAPAMRLDPHSPALVESLFIAELECEAPREVLLVGITGEAYEPGVQLSAAVRSAVPVAIEKVLAELDRLSIHYAKRTVPLQQQPGWEAWA